MVLSILHHQKYSIGHQRGCVWSQIVVNDSVWKEDDLFRLGTFQRFEIWFPFRQYDYVSWTRHGTFAWRFYAWNNWPLNVCRAVLRCEQLVFERLHGGFASWTKGPWTFAWRFCIVNKRSLNVCMTVLHVYKKALKLVHGGFARVQKGLEVGSRGFASCTKGYWS